MLTVGWAWGGADGCAGRGPLQRRDVARALQRAAAAGADYAVFPVALPPAVGALPRPVGGGKQPNFAEDLANERRDAPQLFGDAGGAPAAPAAPETAAGAAGFAPGAASSASFRPFIASDLCADLGTWGEQIALVARLPPLAAAVSRPAEAFGEFERELAWAAYCGARSTLVDCRPWFCREAAGAAAATAGAAPAATRRATSPTADPRSTAPAAAPLPSAATAFPPPPVSPWRRLPTPPASSLSSFPPLDPPAASLPSAAPYSTKCMHEDRRSGLADGFSGTPEEQLLFAARLLAATLAGAAAAPGAAAGTPALALLLPAAAADGGSLSWAFWNELRLVLGRRPLAVALSVDAQLPTSPASAADLDRWVGEPVVALALEDGAFGGGGRSGDLLPRQFDFLHSFLRTQRSFGVILAGGAGSGGSSSGSSRSDRMADDDAVDAQFQMRQSRLRAAAAALRAEAREAGSEANSARSANFAADIFPGSDSGDSDDDYNDYLQAPLQPLTDNLESSVYAVFERDPHKYRLYARAIERCLEDAAPRDLHVIAVVGAGRGPLVDAAFKALRARALEQKNFILVAVEKNPHAAVTLRSRIASDRSFGGWWSSVRLLERDMRHVAEADLFACTGGRRIDVLVSELLGSFGDNELSPECLDGVERLLAPGAVSIPTEYVSSMEPVCCQRLWAETAAGRSDAPPLKMLESTHVVKLAAVYKIAAEGPKDVFTFRHPRKAQPAAAQPAAADPAAADPARNSAGLAPLCAAHAPCAAENRAIAAPPPAAALPQQATAAAPPSAPLPATALAEPSPASLPAPAPAPPALLPAGAAPPPPASLPATAAPPPPPAPTGGSNSRFACLTFTARAASACTGFAGYFRCTLYREVFISTDPRSPEALGRFSWFPLWLPLREPVALRAGEKLRALVWRRATPARVWYEWTLDAPRTLPVHNAGGWAQAMMQG